MALLTWKPDYSVGDTEIDSDHRYLFDLINSFHDAFTRNRSRREILRLFNRLVSYSEEHFQREEKMMASRGHPGLEQHRNSHARLFGAIFDLQEKLETGSVRIERDTVEFLRTWLTDHIVGNDAYSCRKTNDRSKETLPAVPARPWYEVLQIPADSPMEEISRAYRRRVSEYHPDKVAQLGEEIREVAERRTKEINSAYDEATRQRRRGS